MAKKKHADVSVKKGRRLAHGYATVKGKKNKTYEKGGMFKKTFKYIPLP